MQHSHSRHQKTISNLLRINLKGMLRFGNGWLLTNLWQNFGVLPEKGYFFAMFSKYWWFQTKRFTRLLEFILNVMNKTQERIFFFFTIYPNCTILYIGFKHKSYRMSPHVCSILTHCAVFERYDGERHLLSQYTTVYANIFANLA